MLTHRALERLGEGLVVLAELRVSPGAPALMGGPVLLPQQHQRDALAAQLDVHAGKVGLEYRHLGDAAPQQPPLQGGLLEVGYGGPIQARGARQPEVLGHDALGDAQAACDGLVRQRSAVLESEDVLDHAYVHSLLRHRRPGKKSRDATPHRWSIRNTSTGPLTGRRPPSSGYQTSPGCVTEIIGHAPEFGGHAPETVGHAPPKYAPGRCRSRRGRRAGYLRHTERML